MTLLEKITQIKNPKTFTLFREGIFYKCYNEDAMLFTQHVKAYRINVKYIKSTDSKVLSTGFPQKIFDQVEFEFEAITKSLDVISHKKFDNCVVFNLSKDLKQGYSLFEESVLKRIDESKKDPLVMDDFPYSNLIAWIKNYDLANHSPMEALNFVQKLKDFVRENNG